MSIVNEEAAGGNVWTPPNSSERKPRWLSSLKGQRRVQLVAVFVATVFFTLSNMPAVVGSVTNPNYFQWQDRGVQNVVYSLIAYAAYFIFVLPLMDKSIFRKQNFPNALTRRILVGLLFSILLGSFISMFSSAHFSTSLQTWLDKSQSVTLQEGDTLNISSTLNNQNSYTFIGLDKKGNPAKVVITKKNDEYKAKVTNYVPIK